MERDSFVFYRSFYEAISEIQDKALRMDCFDAIVMYALYGVEPKEGSEIVQMVFKLVKPQIDANNRKYENGKKGAEFGKLGGRPKKVKNPLGVINENPLGVMSETPNVNVNVNDNVNVNVKERDKRENKGAKAPRSPFKKPTVDEVSQYCHEHGYQVDANSFVDFYTSKGWKVGKEPMKDWQACVRTWARRDDKKKVTQFQQNNYDFGLLEEQLLDN